MYIKSIGIKKSTKYTNTSELTHKYDILVLKRVLNIHINKYIKYIRIKLTKIRNREKLIITFCVKLVLKVFSCR